MKDEFDKEITNLKSFLDASKGPYLTGKDYTLADLNTSVFISLVVHNGVYDLE